jgi:hypothetical protein
MINRHHRQDSETAAQPNSTTAPDCTFPSSCGRVRTDLPWELSGFTTTRATLARRLFCIVDMAWPTSLAHLAAAAAHSPDAAAIRDMASVACGYGSARFALVLTADTLVVWHVLGSDAGGTLEVASYRRSEHDVRTEGAAEQSPRARPHVPSALPCTKSSTLSRIA